jgi:hypothetical protein
MTSEERLDSLLLAWQEARDAGRDVPAEELCRDCPQLLVLPRQSGRGGV